MYKRYLLDMLMKSSEEHVDLEVMTEVEFVKRHETLGKSNALCKKTYKLG